MFAHHQGWAKRPLFVEEGLAVVWLLTPQLRALVEQRPNQHRLGR